ncbi:MAG: DUF5683 domain-containing protein [Candidatus Zixiibacteriota bacterium]
MRKKVQISTVMIILLLLYGGAFADDTEPTDTPDTSLIVLEADTTLKSNSMGNSRPPMGALLRSVAFPGWGQLYNRKYVKGLVVMAGEGYVLVQAVRYWDLTDKAYDRFTGEDNFVNRSIYYNDYNFYKDRRNLYMWLSGLTLFLSMIDAYVDAHLAGFDVDITPPFDDPANDALTLSLTYRF